MSRIRFRKKERVVCVCVPLMYKKKTMRNLEQDREAVNDCMC